MSYYRIDRRDFEVGDVITPNAAFIANIGETRRQTEELLERERPVTKPNRNEIVKLFDSFAAARKYWILDPDSKFYEVEIEEEDILHRGNYPLVEQLAKETSAEIRNELATQYWNEEAADETVSENYVNQAIVIRIVCKDEKVRQNTKKDYYNLQTMPNIAILRVE